MSKKEQAEGGFMKPEIAFFDTKPYDREYFTKINSDYGYKFHFYENRLDPETASLAGGSNSVCAFVNDDLSEAVIDKLYEEGIKIIALRSAGYNNVDLKSVFNKIHVVRVPAYSPHAVAEHAAALILGLNRKTHRAYYRIRDNNFAISGLMGFDMYGKTAGIIGTGKIGKCAASILKGFGMNVLLYDKYPDPEFAKNEGFEYTGLKDLYSSSDIISLHCPLTPETMHMVNNESISEMKDGVMIINTGRGGLINTKDLVENLKNGKIGSAGLDVYEEETEYFFEDFSSSNITDDVLARLLTFSNVLITSHQGFFTKEAVSNIADVTLNNLKQFFENRKLPNEICYKCGQSTPCRKDKEGRCF